MLLQNLKQHNGLWEKVKIFPSSTHLICLPVLATFLSGGFMISQLCKWTAIGPKFLYDLQSCMSYFLTKSQAIWVNEQGVISRRT